MIRCAFAAGIAYVPDYVGLGDPARHALFILLTSGWWWVTESLPACAVSLAVVRALTALLGVVLSNVISNTAAASVLIPIVLALGGSQSRELTLVTTLALSRSGGMCLPVSTPPIALALASGFASSRRGCCRDLGGMPVREGRTQCYTPIRSDWPPNSLN